MKKYTERNKTSCNKNRTPIIRLLRSCFKIDTLVTENTFYNLYLCISEI